MQGERRAVFLMDLLQDVNILRPLVLLAHQDLGLPVVLLQSRSFGVRDVTGLWREELAKLAASTRGSLHSFESEFDAWRLLSGGHGVLVSASESDQPPHRVNHAVFGVAPPGYLRVTVQHGFECIGFLPNREHLRAHGRSIHFAADVICGWTLAERMTGVLPAERSKLYIAGPPFLLQPRRASTPTGTGLVCENLHSVRLRASGDFRMSFMETFFAFCRSMAGEGERVTLRPHPGGQYFQKNAIALPQGIELQNAPAYDVDFSTYSYGISAPSSVLIDMLAAGIPVAVWQDEAAIMDAGNYAGLPFISTLDEWLAFRRAAREERERLLEGQARFLERTGLLLDASEVRRRYGALFAAGPSGARLANATVSATKAASPASRRAAAKGKHGKSPVRIAFVANAIIPTLEIYFTRPLAPLIDSKGIEPFFITEQQMKEKFGRKLREEVSWNWTREKLEDIAPDFLVFCRYSGPHAQAMADHARQLGIVTVLHLDDDLLNVPIELGQRKFDYHNHPARLGAIRYLLDHVDLVYCSTQHLKERFVALGAQAPIWVGPLAVGADTLFPVKKKPVTTLGYMGFDHELDFKIALPAVVQVMEKFPQLRFELFGSIPLPAELEPFGDRVEVIPPVRGYGDFLDAFAARRWDIGICPLLDTPFNRRKSNLKWVEYTAVGAAVVATSGTIYDECMSDGHGCLVDTQAEWFAALSGLIEDPASRHAMVKRAQAKLKRDFSLAQIRGQVIDMLNEAKRRAAFAPPGEEGPGEDLILPIPSEGRRRSMRRAAVVPGEGA